MNRTLAHARRGYDGCRGGRRRLRANLSRRALVLLVVLQLLPAALEAQFNYQTNNGTITITAYTGSAGSVVVPATISDLPVTAIGTNAFSSRLSLGSVALPDTVLVFENGAFQDCRNLTNLNLPANLTAIGDYAFNACWGISNLVFPNSVTNIGTSAFGSCHNLGTISLPGNLGSIGDHSFNNCFGLTSVAVSDSVRNIGPARFIVARA